MHPSNEALDTLAVRTLRMLAIDMVEQAKSGHPGMPMGAAPMAYVLFKEVMRHDPGDPTWPDRDRFILSAGHGSALLYSLLHLSGYDLALTDLKSFRQWESKTPGHPEYGHTPGVEATTGPLGQGVAMAVGMAMAETHLAARYNRPDYTLFDHYTYALVGDGDLMEGISHEAASLAGHLGLGKLIVLYDSNDVSLDGALHKANSEDVAGRFRAYGWQVLRVEDGNDLDAIRAALTLARANLKQPTLIEVKTTIGYGAPTVAGTSKAHGAPLGPEERARVAEAYGWDGEPFTVPEAVYEHFEAVRTRGAALRHAWEERFRAYQTAYPEEGAALAARLGGSVPEDLLSVLPDFEGDLKMATREASGKVLQVMAKAVPALWGGSADLATSNNTLIHGENDFSRDEISGRNIWFGVREHAMGAVLNGLALHGGVRPYGATFLVFSDYLRPAIRLSALMKQPVLYIFTHDSIAVGEDGPTHQPVEQLSSLRLIPDLDVIRPADARETAYAYAAALQEGDHPTALVLTRQKLPVLPETKGRYEDFTRGAYLLYATNPAEEAPLDVLFMASGSEVALALGAARRLEEVPGLRVAVISVPSFYRLERMPDTDKQKLFGRPARLKVAIEMGSGALWYRYVGSDGLVFSVERFGASAPGETVVRAYGFSEEAIVQRIIEGLG
ncbi:MAG: Transketolase [Candidatus Carbobacillus altaicus]|uniref:Transketolase n=1 Tax=Candidatus Carbonibacillus altaicus TaxID=2163959 RepID=A0A2R6Y0C4_9BACL|nr:MAG: Transketolase [Candidatus Carbobacillus altaicus]